MRLTEKQWAALHDLEWGMKHFGGLVPSAAVPTRTLRALGRKGLAVEVGPVLVCDGDGFILQPERWRAGWELTEAGRSILATAARASS